MATIQPIKAAEYVYEQTTELAKLSRKMGLNTVAYVLEVAALEAERELTPKKRTKARISAHQNSIVRTNGNYFRIASTRSTISPATPR